MREREREKEADAARKETFDPKCYIPCLLPQSFPLSYPEVNGEREERADCDQNAKQSVDSLIPHFFTLGYNMDEIKFELPVVSLSISFLFPRNVSLTYVVLGRLSECVFEEAGVGRETTVPETVRASKKQSNSICEVFYKNRGKETN